MHSSLFLLLKAHEVGQRLHGLLLGERLDSAHRHRQLLAAWPRGVAGGSQRVS